MRSMADFIAAMPKAELHCHLEGTLEPELIFALARRNGVALRYPSVEALRAAYRFRDLQDFLDLYYQGTSVLLVERDFYDLTAAYLARAAAQNIVHAELFFDPQAHLSRGVPFAAIIGGIARALRDGEADCGHHLAADPVLPARPQRGGGRGDARCGTAVSRRDRRHRPRFRRARQSAGQVSQCLRAGGRARPPPRRPCRRGGPAAYIGEALDALKVERIDHGNRCLDDPRWSSACARAASA